MGKAVNIQRNIVIFLILGILVTTALSFWGDKRQVASALEGVAYESVAVIVGIALLNQFIRFLRWHYFLRRAGSGISFAESFAVYCSGLLMAVTPGRMGEFLRGYFVKNIDGTPIRQTTPVIVGEKISDGLGLLVCGAAGALFFTKQLPFFILAIALTFLTIFLLRKPDFILYILDHIPKNPLLGSLLEKIKGAYACCHEQLSVRSFILPAVLSACYWLLEGLLLAYILGIFSIHIPLILCIFILFISNILGAASMIPGGVGLTETSMVGLLMAFNASNTLAVVSTLLLRFASLWLGVVIGMIAFLLYGRRFFQTE